MVWPDQVVLYTIMFSTWLSIALLLQEQSMCSWQEQADAVFPAHRDSTISFLLAMIAGLEETERR